MTRTYRCMRCGKFFYFYGRVDEALGKLIDAKCLLSQNGFNVEDVPAAWGVIQSNARCCEHPDITVVSKWGTLL